MSDAWVETRSEETVGGITDEELAAAAARGDERAFEQLVGRYSTRIYSLAYRFLNDGAEAEDAVQEVFIKVYRALPKSRLDLPFRPWIYKIATNECINRSKKRRDKVVDVDEFLENIPDDNVSPQEAVVEKELQEILTRAIASLPERYRPVVILRYTEGLSFREIGEVLGIPEGTAKTFFARSKDLLRERLTDFETE